MATGSLEFTVNGKVQRVAGLPAHTTLLQYLRSAGLTGTKEGCAEGDCGACTVALVDRDAKGARVLRALNSCITLLPMVHGRELVTVEGVAPAPGELHPVQSAVVERYGSQCGYCTPGFICSMYEGYYREDLATREQLVDQLNGNLCRCTGYRPLREAMLDALAHKAKQTEPDLVQLSLRKPAEPLGALDYEGGGERFLRPTSLEELLRLRAEHPAAHLIAGATELGVEVTKKARRFPLLISTEAVPELHRVEAHSWGWRIGGAVTLTALEEALAGALPALDKMLWAFASRQVRNRATLAGNLVTASPIGDLAPVLLALDAELELASTRGVRTVALSDFFLSYRKTALAPEEVLLAVRLPRPAAERARFDTFKVSKRRELDISIVAAAFAVRWDEHEVVRHARLAYGGVAATPARARATEAFLLGKPWSAETVAAAAEVLEGEFKPLDDVRAGAPYRRGLASSLFEKFFSGEQSEGQDHKLTFERAAPLELPPELAPHGRTLGHDSAVGHVTGAAEYVDDAARKRPMLELWPVCSPHAHARVLRVDASAALAAPGVVTVLTAKDIPGLNDVGAIRHDETLLADTEALFHGHMVAVVVGESYELCRAAAALVRVDYEPLPAVLSVPQALREGSFHTDPHVIARGDVEAALAAAPHTLEGTFELGGQEHFYLESQAAWAEVGDDGGLFVSSSTQHPSEVQALVAHVLDLPRNRVVVQSPRMGGAFGGKETQGASWAALTALAAVKTGRPARVQLDRDLDMKLTGKRHPFHASFRVGFDDRGLLLGARVELTADGGWALDLSQSISDRALFHLDNCYYLPAVRFQSRVAKTHTVSHTAFRGFGGPQGMVVIEEVLDRVARSLGLRPEDVRERNLYRGEGEQGTTHYGQTIEDNRLEALWRALRESSHFDARRAEIERFNARGGRLRRGLALTPVKFGISFTASWLNQAGALVLVYRDGSAQVNHGGTEMGQGLHAKILGIAMRELGLPAELVRVMKTRTDKVPNTSATAASSGSDLNGAAVQNACETLRGRLAPVAAAMLERSTGAGVDPSALRFEGGAVRAPSGASVPFAAVAEQAYMQQISLSAAGYYRTPGLAYDRTKGRGRPFHYFAFGAAVAEVELDGYTGMKRVRRVDVLHDVGATLNPGVDRGQLEGGFVQGMGWLTGEELKWDSAGRLLSHSASTYQIPSFGDAPTEFRVAFWPRAAQAGTIHGSKAVGEPPLMLAIAVREALRDAVAAFAQGPGVVELASPATHEALFHAVRARRGVGPHPAASP